MVVVFNFSSFIPGLMAQTQTQHQRQQQQQQRQQLHPFYLKLNHLEDLTTDNIRNIVTTFLNRIPQYEEEDNSDGPRIIVKLRNRNLLENAREILVGGVVVVLMTMMIACLMHEILDKMESLLTVQH